MGCLKLTYNQAFETPLKVVYRTAAAEQKSVQRFFSTDPLQSEMPEWSSYSYGFCNPIIWTDPTGMQPEDPPQVGHIYVVQFEDASGNPMNVPEGTSVPYSPFKAGGKDGNATYAPGDPYAGKESLVAGAHVISEATGGAATFTTTLTYRYHFGENEGNLSLAGYDQTFTTPPEFREGTQTTVTPVEGMINTIPLNIPFVLNSGDFQNPEAAQAQINTLANQLQNVGIDNINLVVTTQLQESNPKALPLVQARFNTASDAFTAAGINVNALDFKNPNLYEALMPSMTAHIPPTPGITGWNVTSQEVRQGLAPSGNPVGNVSPVPGSQSTTTFRPNDFTGRVPQGNVRWQANPQPRIQRSSVWEPLIKIR